MKIDLNADLGEGAGSDADLIELVSSASIACGAHAGNPATMFATLAACVQAKVRVGAHVGHADRANFGRVELKVDPTTVYAESVTQIGALAGLAKALAAKLFYIKPHGGLYHQACRDDDYARPVVAAAELFSIAVMGLPNSALERVAKGRVRFIREGFADRRMKPDGTLVNRRESDAIIRFPDEAARQAQQLVYDGRVESICLHGDHPDAVLMARAVREALQRGGVAVSA